MEWLRSAALCALACTLACQAGPKPTPAPAAEAAAAAPVLVPKPPVPAPAPEQLTGALPVDEAALDKAADPCDDFYQYACGGWMQSTPIPAERSLWTRSFSEINERNEALVKQILEDAAAGKADSDNPFGQKIGDFYATCMDEEKAETASLATLKDELKKVDALKDLEGAARLLATFHARGVRALFEFGADQDFKDARQVIGIADQGGMGLPDRDFYLKDDRQQIRDAYQALVEHQLVNLGDKPAAAKKAAQTVVALETALAKVALGRVERRDPYKIYHRIDRTGLAAAAPHFAWSAYFDEAGAPELQAINVTVPDFFTGLDALFASKKQLADLKTYLRWHLLSAATPTLGKKFVDESFAFESKLTGQKALLPRWKRCVNQTVSGLSEAVGRSYVSRAFGKQSKPMALDTVQRVEAVFEADLAGLTWMDDATKQQAREKLHKMANKIGFPDSWRDYSTLEVGRDSLLKNRLAAAAFESKRQLAKVGKPVDRGEHGMPPTLVNAEYNASMNDMTFPAAILQPPFFSADAAATANYGGIGMVVGHELTHGFDDEGRQYDGDGNLRDWWTQSAGDAYKQKAACVASQYSQYEVVPGVKLNGELTLGENIADNGGVKLAYQAYKALRAGKPGPLQGALNEDQQFFLAYAQSWCASVRPEAAKLRAQTDPHSAPRFRVNGTLSNSTDFAAAFQCKAGSKMAPESRCQVW
jgi:endothelin-converting enzyme/putative endopeptidase